MDACVAHAIQAQKLWREIPVQQRVRVLLKLVPLLHENKDEIVQAMVRENGKTVIDAEGDLSRGIEVVEHAIAMPSLMMGETVEQISKNMDTASFRQPLGVVAGIAPFNFPAMIVLWMLPLAVGTGNALILKPSEKVPTFYIIEIYDSRTLSFLPDWETKAART
jgi:malonate-semialdehyde dehydrogenase (acetylating) / methylmalonate-semialdehyde dehydrogenase